MSSNQLQRFIDALVDDTLHNRLNWVYIDRITDDLLKFCENVFLMETFVNEFRQIDEHRSYACITNAGMVYLIYSMLYPGDGSAPFDQYELYLHPEPYNTEEYYRLSPDESELYRLENAVRSNASNSLRGTFGGHGQDYYIELFLRDRR